MNDDFDKMTSSLRGRAKYGIQKYWLGSFPCLYNEWYDWYDKEEPAKHISQIISQYNTKDKNQLNILDCSCGTGNPSLSLVKRGFNVTSSDGSAEMLETIKKNSQKTNVQLNVATRPVLWEQLIEHFGGNKFDIVICSGNSICHLPPAGVKESIKQMVCVLEEGGLLLIDAKKYSKQIREMEYREGQSWTVRTQRLDKRVINNDKVKLRTTLSYFGEDKPGRRYQVQLDWHIGEDHKNRVFPVWAITSDIIKGFMKEEGLQIFPSFEAWNHSEWQYEFCVGKKN